MNPNFFAIIIQLICKLATNVKIIFWYIFICAVVWQNYMLILHAEIPHQVRDDVVMNRNNVHI